MVDTTADKNENCLFLQTHHFWQSEIDRFYTALGFWTNGRRTDAGRTDGRTDAILKKNAFFKTPSQAEIREKDGNEKNLTPSAMVAKEVNSCCVLNRCEIYTTERRFFRQGVAFFFC